MNSETSAMPASTPHTHRRTRIKLCGFKHEADVAVAVACGADAIGFVIYPPSPRAVSMERMAELAAQLPPFVTPVALVVNPSSELLTQIQTLCPQATVQFHGDEDPLEVEAWHARSHMPYLRAVRMKADTDLLNLSREHPHARALLLDAFVEGYGGGGKAFDWSWARTIQNQDSLPLVLSGGLHVSNVGDGVEQLRPWAVDVSSGIESSKGVKSHQLIQAFCQAVRMADAQMAAVAKA